MLMLRRPWAEAGVGWVVALSALILAVVSLFVATTIPHLLALLVIGLALALLVG